MHPIGAGRRVGEIPNEKVSFELMRTSHNSEVPSQQNLEPFKMFFREEKKYGSSEKVTHINQGARQAWQSLVSLVAVNHSCSESD